MQFKTLFAITLLTLALVPATASAQQGWYVTPFIGANFGAAANFGDFGGDAEDEFERRLDLGVAGGWNPRVIGFEVDLGWSPNFFENTVGTGNFQTGDSNLITLMGNVLFSLPPGSGLRPYASTGFGWIRSTIGNDSVEGFPELKADDWGFNVGGGVNGNFTDSFAIRGDLRYFRSLEDNEVGGIADLQFSKFDFWRGTVGVTFGW